MVTERESFAANIESDDAVEARENIKKLVLESGDHWNRLAPRNTEDEDD